MTLQHGDWRRKGNKINFPLLKKQPKEDQGRLLEIQLGLEHRKTLSVLFCLQTNGNTKFSEDEQIQDTVRTWMQMIGR